MAKLKSVLVASLRPYIRQHVPTQAAHEEIPPTYIKAAFFDPREILANNHAPEPDHIEYSFAERRALYLRLIPTFARTSQLKEADLHDLARNRQIDLLVRQRYTGLADRNRFGAIVYEWSGTSNNATRPDSGLHKRRTMGNQHRAICKLARPFLHPDAQYRDHLRKSAGKFRRLSQEVFGNGWPMTAVVGGVGLNGLELGVGHDYEGQIHRDAFELRLKMGDGSRAELDKVIDALLDEIFNLAGVRR